MAQLAARQHGVVARRQLLAHGIDGELIQRRLESGHLHRVHLGVYAVGHPNLTPNGRLMAAVLACGADALLSHRSAAALWGIAARRSGRIDVTVHRESSRSRPGIAIHRPRELQSGDRRSRYGIPVTAPSRTLLDLAGVLGAPALREAIQAADRCELLEVDRLIEIATHSSGRRGTGTLLSLLSRYRPLPETRSWLEDRFLPLVDDAGLSRPAVDVVVEGFEVDCLWPDERVIVELDSYGFHRDPETFESDRRRDVALQLAGYVVLRFTYRRVVDEPREVIAELVAALTQAHPGRR
jgi:predicted transcriptional regulator of viral defense system